MNTKQFEASLLKAIEGMQEAVAALNDPQMRVNGDATCDAPISTLTSQGSLDEDEQKELLRQAVEEGISRAKAQMGHLWRVVDSGEQQKTLVTQFTTGPIHNAVALAKLINALVHWHGEMPDEDQLSAALGELSRCYPQGEWQNVDFDFRLFDGPAQAEFWNGGAYATPFAAQKDGAIYATDDKVPSIEAVWTIASAASEVWGHEYSQSIAISFAP